MGGGGEGAIHSPQPTFEKLVLSPKFSKSPEIIMNSKNILSKLIYIFIAVWILPDFSFLGEHSPGFYSRSGYCVV